MSSPREFNPPALMLARLAYALHLGLALGSLVLAVGAAAGKRADLAAEAFAALILAAGLRWLLRRRDLIKDCEESLNRSLGTGAADYPPDPGATDPRLASLLSQKAWIEEQRGSPAFDPWALLAVQHDIEEHLRKTHPQADDPPNPDRTNRSRRPPD